MNTIDFEDRLKSLEKDFMSTINKKMSFLPELH